jgi:hypothetical protein
MAMKTNRHRTLHRHCTHCGQLFAVNPRLGKRHRYCSEPECARASHRASHKKWQDQGDYKLHYTSEDNVERVRSWRQRHPEYWKRKRRPKRLSNAKFALTEDFSSILRYVALQDSIDTRLALEIGIISRLCGVALQDTIAKEIRRLIIRGHAILRNKPARASR